MNKYDTFESQIGNCDLPSRLFDSGTLTHLLPLTLYPLKSNTMTTQPDFSYLRRRAEESKQWIAAGCQVGDEYDTYPHDLFRSAANEDAVIALLDTLETTKAELGEWKQTFDDMMQERNEALAKLAALQSAA